MPYIGNIVQDFSVNTAMLNTDSVTSIKIDDGTIVNADINDSAAIAGTKISPDFGSQNIATTGTLSCDTIASNDITISDQQPRLNFVDNSGSPNNPDYLFQVDGGQFVLHDSTNGVNKFAVQADGHMDFVPNCDFAAGIDVTGNITTTGSITATTGTITSQDITIQDQQPRLNFVDNAGSPNDPDYLFQVDGGSFLLHDSTNVADRFSIAANGTLRSHNNHDFSDGIDVTGATTLTRSTDNQTTTIITNNGTTGGHCLKLTSGGTGAGTNIFSCFRDNQSSESEVLNVNGSGVLTVTPGTAGTVALFASSGTTNGGVLDLRNTQGSNQTFRLAVGGGDNAYVQGRGFFIRDETNSATRLAIDTSGNTSLGTGTPASNTKLLIRDDSATTTVMLRLRNYKSSVNTKPTLRFEAVSSTGQGASSDIQGLAGTDAGAANDNGNDSAMKFIVRHGGSGTEREAFTVKNDGNIHFPNGQGIDFGVTSGGNSSSELFDDYEEGTFTPVINYDGNDNAGQTYNEQQGKYVKVGRFVHFVLRIDINNPGTGDGWVSISGFPYNMEDMLSGITYEPTVNAEIHDAATAVGNVRAMFIPSGSVYLMLTTAQVSWFNSANRFGKSTYITGGTDIRIRGYYMSTT